MKYGELDFKKMDLDRHSEIAIKFYADTHFTSFDTDKDFLKEMALAEKDILIGLKNKIQGNLVLFTYG